MTKSTAKTSFGCLQLSSDFLMWNQHTHVMMQGGEEPVTYAPTSFGNSAFSSRVLGYAWRVLGFGQFLAILFISGRFWIMLDILPDFFGLLECANFVQPCFWTTSNVASFENERKALAQPLRVWHICRLLEHTILWTFMQAGAMTRMTGLVFTFWVCFSWDVCTVPLIMVQAGWHSRFNFILFLNESG